MCSQNGSLIRFCLGVELAIEEIVAEIFVRLGRRIVRGNAVACESGVDA